MFWERRTVAGQRQMEIITLLHVKPPIAIVECGFLSNRAEAAKLQDEVYQDRMAWTVHMGIMEFFK